MVREGDSSKRPPGRICHPSRYASCRFTRLSSSSYHHQLTSHCCVFLLLEPSASARTLAQLPFNKTIVAKGSRVVYPSRPSASWDYRDDAKAEVWLEVEVKGAASAWVPRDRGDALAVDVSPAAPPPGTTCAWTEPAVRAALARQVLSSSTSSRECL